MANSVEHGSGEDSNNVSDSEMEEYAEKANEELKSGKHRVKLSDQTFTCPYCPKKKKGDYQINELLHHATSIGQSSSQKISVKDKVNHIALAKYLESDIAAGGVGPSKPPVEGDSLEDRDGDEKFVWPWIGIVVNIPTSIRDGRYVGKSGSELRDRLMSRGFDPTRVRPLWNYQGHSGTAIVEFQKDWSGFINAMSFDKDYETNNHGRRSWLIKDVTKSGHYAWVARADDYNAGDIIGENLRKIGNLRTVKDITEEEDRKAKTLEVKLKNVNEAKKMLLQEVENKFIETESSLSRLVKEKDDLYQAYNEEIKKIESSAQDHYRRIFNDHERLKSQVENQKKELESRSRELSKRDTHNEIERKKLLEDLEQNAVKNCSLQAAADEQEKTGLEMRKFADEHKRQMEEFHKKRIKVDKLKDAERALELEVEQLRGILNVKRHVIDGSDLEVLKEVDTLQKALREKEQELEELETLNQTLIVHERLKNDELQDARKELINDTPLSTRIGVKRMGELDSKPFHDALKRKYNDAEAEERSMELCSLWEEYLKDPEWHPIKVVTINGKEQAEMQDDEKLRELKESYGEEVYNAVVAALFEITEYNPSGRYIITELWNYEEHRRAPLAEGVAVLLNQWKSQRRRRGVN